METGDILNNLNIIAEKLFKSVEGQVYEVLDKIVVIGPEILKQEPLRNVFLENKVNGVIIIANALVLFYVVYYTFTQLMCLYNGNKAENIYLFILKLVVVSIFVNNSYFICEQLLTIVDAFTNAITMFTEQIAGKQITFENLKENILSIKDFMKNDLFTLDGLIKGIISFGAVSILINFSIRYVTIIFLIIISPIALVTLSSNITNGIFKTWGRTLVISLLTQVVVKIIIFIPIMYKEVDSVMYKIILVGSIYLLYRLNNFVKDIFVNISTTHPINNLFK
ncbi:MAG: hypothetical protein RSG48_06580 [Clostridia bacterium]